MRNMISLSRCLVPLVLTLILCWELHLILYSILQGRKWHLNDQISICLAVQLLDYQMKSHLPDDQLFHWWTH